MPASPLPPGRTMRFGDPSHHEEFAAWLARRGIKSETVDAQGGRYLVWDDGAHDSEKLINEFMLERAKRRRDQKQTAK
ncbi:hypothetical protein D3C83_85510 [compost metagenome]